MLYVAAAAGGRPGLRVAVFDQPAMAERAASMKGFPQARFAIFFLSNVAFPAAEFFTFEISFNEFIIDRTQDRTRDRPGIEAGQHRVVVSARGVVVHRNGAAQIVALRNLGRVGFDVACG